MSDQRVPWVLPVRCDYMPCDIAGVLYLIRGADGESGIYCSRESTALALVEAINASAAPGAGCGCRSDILKVADNFDARCTDLESFAQCEAEHLIARQWQLAAKHLREVANLLPAPPAPAADEEAVRLIERLVADADRANVVGYFDHLELIFDDARAYLARLKQ